MGMLCQEAPGIYVRGGLGGDAAEASNEIVVVGGEKEDSSAFDSAHDNVVDSSRFIEARTARHNIS